MLQWYVQIHVFCCQYFIISHILCAYVTEFWKITHMGAREIIRIFMFSGLLIRAG